MVIRFTVRSVVTNMLTKLKQNPLFQLAALVFLPGAYICAGLIVATNFYYGVPDWLDWGLIWFNALLGGLVSLGSALNDVKNWIENE